MNYEESGTQSTSAPALPPESASPPPSFLRNIFVGPSGIRAGWRFAIFALLFVAFFVIELGFLSYVSNFGQLYKLARSGTITPGFEVVFELAQFAAALLAAAVMSRIDKRPLGSYGIPLRGAFGKNFWTGILWGLGFMSAELLVMHLLGGFSYGTLALTGAALLKYASVWALGFLLVGFAEEYVFRGYAQFTLATGMGFWPAAILLSAAFGAVHLFNAGEGWVGALSVMIFALFACFTLRRTGNLWFAIGFHAAGDYAESFLYSVPDSGNLIPGHLLHSSIHGSKWLTGGSIGPEGSVLVFVMFALSFLLFAWLYPAKESQPKEVDRWPVDNPA
jgi:membrane protease YdiL (CAAX protease family)